MVELGGLAATLEAMKTFDADAEVQLGGGYVLGWMANTGSEIERRLPAKAGSRCLLRQFGGFRTTRRWLR